ncbi:DUF4435 domain-containing protein [Myxococcus llanfairpwllgwyngyllgogerychwyrndrobwllllantysiliogogogochensis]|uniref:DUF4435 domain-containing protein n=1 Tax=Myxococcus llanfairpwllgwyngyllgogerychwyrndrobwllllantysiliogogogochensis TaxID=2590453 RepID=A0A540X714_9BACT|nr:DUF4435 domain-containing protein [Myxococcus llanfairpwllgwyngyllgogerychwyrndrobwllllantysiliogogogochensis]TQF17008.1 DUF4435 domain-containing protein [Myxococcus llanfairpwllgwyngyllgogerychwyrndrobwllllantysiliogogogochensis]
MTEISVENLRSQRERPSVLKTELAHIRSHDRCTLVFVMEGWDDAKTYEVWIHRLSPDLKWETLIAKGKKNALEFRAMLARDQTGLRECTFFIVDHDYDGLAGTDNGADIYVLPAYSVENLLTHTDVLGSLLTTEFRLVGAPQIRARITQQFAQTQAAFSACVRASCETLHATKRTSVGNVLIDEKHLRSIRIELNSATVGNPETLSKLVQTEQTLGSFDLESAREFFDLADLAMWTRGKFMMWFFKDWCAKLMQDRKSANPTLFDNTANDCSLSAEWSGFGSLAGRSPLPEKLDAFLKQAEESCKTNCQRPPVNQPH